MVHIEDLLAEHRELGSGPDRPSVTLSYAQSLDGSITARSGKPFALSGPDSARLTHRLRAAHDAILVGIGTVLADNPRLNVRHIPGRDPQPVILDSRLRTPLDANLLLSSSGGRRCPWVATTAAASQERKEALEAAGARILPLPAAPGGRVHLPALLERLAQLGVRSLMVEGGAQVIGSFFSQRLVDLVLLTLAPVFIGGPHAIEASLEPEGSPIEDSSLTFKMFPRFQDWECERLGNDLVLWGRPVWPVEREG